MKRPSHHMKYPFPRAMETYLKRLRQHCQIEKVQNESLQEIAKACAGLYKVDPLKVINAYESGFSLGLTSADCGLRFASKARDIDNCLKAAAYVRGMECTNNIFDTLL